MQLWYQIYITVKRLLVDYKSFLTYILAYIVIILILGNAFQSEFAGEDFDTVKVLYVNEDEGDAGRNFIKQFQEVDGIKDFIQLKKAKTFEKAEKEVREQEAGALLLIPKDFTKQVNDMNEINQIHIYRSQYSGMDSLIVKSVVDSYINGLNAAYSVYRIQGSLDKFQFDIGQGVENMPLSKEGKTPDSMTYYTVAMILMMLAFGIITGSEGISEEYLGTLGDRVRLSQMHPFVQYAGKLLGVTFVTFLQGVILVAFTSVVYKVDWGTHIGMVLFTFLTFCIFNVSLGGLLVVLLQNKEKAGTIGNTLIFVFTFLAGGFVAMDFGIVKYFAPNTFAQTALHQLIYGGSLTSAWTNIGILWAITMVIIIIACIRAGRSRV